MKKPTTFMSRWGQLRFDLHRVTVCKFFHRKHHKPIPDFMARGYPWGWYCDKCCAISALAQSDDGELFVIDEMNTWKVQIHGKANSSDFEISVVNKKKIDSAQRHYGWFDENKLLISHNGGPCDWPLTPQVWDKLVRVANEVADELNAACHET